MSEFKIRFHGIIIEIMRVKLENLMSVWNKKSLALKTVKKKRGKVLLIHMNDKGLVLKIYDCFY